MRTIILDKEGNAVITTNEDFDKITILVGEQWVKGNQLPAQKFSIASIDSLKSVRDYLNSVISKGQRVAHLKSKHQELTEKYLDHTSEHYKSEGINTELKSIKEEFTKLIGKDSVNGRVQI